MVKGEIMIDLSVIFEKYDDDYLKFDRVEKKFSQRPDLCAFILLDKLLPNAALDMISAAEHDEIFLEVDCDKLAEVATEEDILMLTRCGVRYDDDLDGLAMFV